MEVKDGYIVIDNDEYGDIFSDIDRKIQYSQIIQKHILEVVHERLDTGYNCKGKSIDKMLENLDEDFIEDMIDQINNEMFAGYGKLSYHDKHIPYLLYYAPPGCSIFPGARQAETVRDISSGTSHNI